MQCSGWAYRLEALRALRGRPTLRSFTASRSFGSISHSRPTFIALRRLATIIFRTLSGVTPKRFAASTVLMILMAQVYHSEKLSCRDDNFLDKRKSYLYSDGTHQKERAGKVRQHSPTLHSRLLTWLSERNRPCRMILSRTLTQRVKPLTPS